MGGPRRAHLFTRQPEEMQRASEGTGIPEERSAATAAATILETARRAQEELEALRGAERDPEFEEGAQSEHEQYTLSLLGEVQRRQIAMIDAALARIDSGEYGVCVDCETDIDPKRLAVLPFALLCTECATPARARADRRAPTVGGSALRRGGPERARLRIDLGRDRWRVAVRDLRAFLPAVIAFLVGAGHEGAGLFENLSRR